MTSRLLDDPSICLVEEQVRNGVPVRMALLYLMAAAESAAESSLVSISS
jgi:aspartate carbamoyltransferase catalytic subunit